MSNQPVIFNIGYTPYQLPRSATAAERAAHARDRAFYDMTGDKNIYEYITTEEKRTGGYSMFEYLEKNTGVFNDKGMISKEEIAAMKGRLKENKGNIWHAFISLSAEQSHKIDTPEKCVQLIKRTIPPFLRDDKFNVENIDLMCALHTDRPHHLHIHMVFWEKEPKYKSAKDGSLTYRRVGRIGKRAIDNLFVRLGLYLSEEKQVLYKSRDRALRDLKGLLGAKVFIWKPNDIKKEILSLAKDLPEGGRITYGSKDMEPFRERIDHIVKMVLSQDRAARRSDDRFYRALLRKQREVENICGGKFAFADKETRSDEAELPKYHNKIDVSRITIVKDIEADYRRRQGNLVLNLAKFIKPEYYESKRRRKANDRALKRSLAISRHKIEGLFKTFFSTFGQQCAYYVNDSTHRLHEIEEEMKREKEKESAAQGSGETK